MRDPVPATAEWYRAQARRFVSLAALAVLPSIKDQLMAIAREFEDHARAAAKPSD
ncbi:MAG: hypothetical protein JO256_00775 [Alphaproteobacteria bacterium]|nr:hypothetical protein [Alphaproteobacteria bacterium]